MKVFKKRKRRGSIAVVIVFSMAVAIIMLGMLRVGSTIYASGVTTTKQYADINSMRAICQCNAYRYVTDLMSLFATRNVDRDMPGTTDSAIYRESLTLMQNSLLVPLMEEVTDPTTGDKVMKPVTEIAIDHTTGNPILDPDTGLPMEVEVKTNVWQVQDATTALATMGELHSDTQAQMLAMTTGKDHTYYLTLDEDMILDYSDPSTYVGSNEARVAISPVKITSHLRLKSEEVDVHMSVEGLFLYAQKDVGTNADGSTYNRVSMRITDDGSGNGVQIYRAD